MADDSFSVKEFTPFHPTNTPRGTMYYNLEELTDSQQTTLNSLKIDTIRENNKYLAANPEIRAIIALLLRTLLRHRPMIKIHEFIAKFFNRSNEDIQDEIFEYLDQKKLLNAKEFSEVNLFVSKKSAEKEEISIGQFSDCICSEECTCDRPGEWKGPHYIPFDDTSFKETEHWLTPKSSRTSMILEETYHEATSDELSFSEMAQVIDLDGGDEEEETEASASIYDETVREEDQSETREKSNQASSNAISESITGNQDLIEADDQVNIELQENKESPSAGDENIAVGQNSPEASVEKSQTDEE